MDEGLTQGHWPGAPASAEPAGLSPVKHPPDPGRPTAAWAPELERGDATAELMAGIAAPVRELADSPERYRTRTEQRENMIDHLRAEVEGLRIDTANCVTLDVVVQILY
jgi:hypothetical protein